MDFRRENLKFIIITHRAMATGKVSMETICIWKHRRGSHFRAVGERDWWCDKKTTEWQSEAPFITQLRMRGFDNLFNFSSSFAGEKWPEMNCECSQLAACLSSGAKDKLWSNARKSPLGSWRASCDTMEFICGFNIFQGRMLIPDLWYSRDWRLV